MVTTTNTIATVPAPASTAEQGGQLDLDMVALVARALSHPVRLRILQILGGRGTCWCGDLWAEFSLAQSTISQHLKTLREAGLVRATPCGTSVGYCRDEEQLARYIHWVAALAEPPVGAATLRSLAGGAPLAVRASSDSPRSGSHP